MLAVITTAMIRNNDNHNNCDDGLLPQQTGHWKQWSLLVCWGEKGVPQFVHKCK